MELVMTTELSPVLTIDALKAAVPSKKNAVTQEIVDIINASRNEPEFQGEDLLQTVSTYERVLAGRSGVSLKEYVYAVKFCAYLSTLDDNATEAYKKTFIHRDFVRERLNEPTSSPKYNELTKAASRYRASKLVVDILTYSQIPMHILFTGHRYSAINVLADEMYNAKFSKDRIMAAKELLAATKGPENLKIELDVGIKENSAVQQLNDQLAAMAARQKEMLESGASDLREYGSLRVKADDVIDVEFTQVEK